jgi:hypothetical protein
MSQRSRRHLQGVSSETVFSEPTGPPTPILTQVFGIWSPPARPRFLPLPLGKGWGKGLTGLCRPSFTLALLHGEETLALKQPTVQCFVLHGANVELRSCAGQIIPALLVNVISDDREMGEQRCEQLLPGQLSDG